MPRFRRQIEPRSLQHVISRLLNREFLLDREGARTRMLHALTQSLVRSDWRVVAYALMSNHVHWVFVAGEQPLSTLLRPTHVRFARWYRMTHGGLGPVFADRPRNVAADGESAAALLAYVHNNPVRARVAAHAHASNWTSHRAYVGLASPPPWLDLELGFQLVGLSQHTRRDELFENIVAARAQETRDDRVSGRDQESRRRAQRRRRALPVELTSSSVDLTAQRSVPAIATPLMPVSAPHRRQVTATPQQVVAQVAAFTGIEEERLRARRRTHPVSYARRLAVHCWTLALGQPLSEIADYLGLPRTTASTMLSYRVDPIQLEAVCANLRSRSPRNSGDPRFSDVPNSVPD